MKTAISIPDTIFHEAEAIAEHLGMSRSEFITLAVQQLIEKIREDYITAQLNRVYKDIPSEADPVMFQMAMLALPKEEW